MTEIEHLLAAAAEDHSANRLTRDGVKRWIKRYTSMYEEDVANFPDQQSASHWNLVAADSDWSKDAMFLLAFFTSDLVTFVAGRGNFTDVHDFGENYTPLNPDDVLDEVGRRFWTTGKTTVSSIYVQRWCQS